MSETIDERVVEMRFDNAQFERGVHTSLGTLEKLKKGLDLDSSAKSIENVGTAAKKLDFNPVSAGVDAIKTKFSALEVMAVTALANITNSAVNAGKRLVSALTIDPVKTGFQEYETQINAVQTILANTESKGSTLKDVNNALDELNTYADKTIYNFTEMTRNIGTFTAAGIDLETSTTAIKGIANLAAVSGSTSQQASTAMYQLSQALASGTVKLQDWNSVVNAGMGGQVFQDALKETARVHGIAIDQIIADEGSFRESLKNGWLSADILTETLEKFTLATDGLTEAQIEENRAMLKSKGYTDEQIDAIFKMGNTATDAATKVKTFTQLWDTLSEAAQSGWTSSWEIIVGDFEEAKELLTNVSNVVGDMIAKSADARNKVLQGWKDMGGRKALIDALSNAFKALMNVVTPIKEAFREIFPPVTAKQLVDITNSFKKFTAKLILNKEQMNAVKESFKSFFSVLKAITGTIKKVISAVFNLAKSLSGVVSIAFDAVSAVVKWVSGLIDSVEQCGIFSDILTEISNVLNNATDGFKKFTSVLSEKVDTNGYETVLNILNGIWGFFEKIGNEAVKIGKQISGSLSNAFEEGGIKEIIDMIFNVVGGGLLAALVIKIRGFVKNISNMVGEISDIASNFSGILGGVKDCLNSFAESVKADALLKIAKAVALLAASVFVLAMIDENRLFSAVTALGAIFAELGIALKIFGKLNAQFKGVVKTISMMNGIAVAVLILASAVKKLSALSWEELGRGLSGIVGLMTEMLGATAVLSKINTKNLKKSASSFIVFGVALNIMASAAKKFAKFSWEEIGKGLTGAAGLTTIMVGATAILSKIKVGGIIKSAASFIIFAVALNNLAITAKIFSKMSWEEIGKGFAGASGLTAIILAATAVLSKIKVGGIIKSAASFIVFGIALNNLAISAKIFAKMSWEEIGKGLTGASGLAAVVVTASAILSKIKVSGIIKSAGSFVIFGAALNIMAAAAKSFAKMSWIEMAKGFTAIGGSLAILAIGLRAMKGTIGGSAALSAAAGALVLLVPELMILGRMKITQIFTALGALAGTFIVLGVAAKRLAPLAGSLTKVAGAIALLGVGCALAGTGMLAVSVGLTALSASLVIVMNSLGEIISGFFDSIASSAESMTNALVTVIKSVCIAVKETVPLITETLLSVLVEALTSLKNYIPQLVDLVCDIVTGLLDQLSAQIPAFAESFANLLKGFAEGLNNVLGDGGWENILLSVTAISGVFLALAAAAKLISSIPIKGAAKGIAGFAIVIAGFAAILAALGGLAQISGFNWILKEGVTIFGTLGEAIGAFIGCLVNGLIENAPSDLTKVIPSLVSLGLSISAIAGVAKVVGQLKLDPKAIAKGFAGVGVAIAAIAAILAALGGLKQIPGFDWIISEGGDLLCKIAYILGEVVGSIVQGLTDAITSSVDKVVSAILDVGAMIGAVAVIAKVVGKLKINPAAVAEGFAGVGVAIGCIEVILAALGGLAQIPGFNWIIEEGGKALCKLGSILGEFIGSIISGLGVGLTSGLPDIGDNLSRFMVNATPFITGAKNIDESVMKGVGALAEAILCLTAADIISSIASFITGGSSIAKFGEEIAEFGPCLKQFSDSVAGIDNRAVTAAAEAGKALADMASTIPNEGGMVAWFTGENSVAKFGGEIASFGKDLSAFALSVSGINPQNVVAAAEAGKALADMASVIPNEGGVVSWFTGDNSVAKFGGEIASFGKDLLAFSVNVQGIIPANIVAAAEAGKALADMASVIPNEGGIAAWFAGDNSVSKFGTEIADFGPNLKAFSDGVMGIIPANIVAAAEAGKALADMASIIPNEGGIAAWFAGENSVAKFGTEIANFGPCLKQFSDSVMGIVPQNVTAAAEAGKSLAEMVSVIPKEGGIQEWFGGKSSVSKFGAEIAGFGVHLKTFSDNVKGINPQNVTAASEAGKSLAEMASNIPKEGGIKAWFAGESSISKFGVEIASFGAHIKSFSDNVKGISPENVTAAANAGKTLAELTNTLPSENGIAQWFGGEKSLAHFGDNVASFGASMKSFDGNVKGISPENVTAAAEAGKALAELTNTLPSENGIKQWFGGEKSLASFGDNVASFGASMKSFSDNVANIVPQNVKAAAEAGKALVELTNTVPTSGGIEAWFCGEKSLASFGDDIADFGKCIAEFSENVADIVPANVETAANAGKALVDLFNTIPEEVDVDDFGDAVITFGGTVKLFTDALNEIDVSYSIDQVEQILDMAEDIRKADLSGMNKLATSLANVADDGITKFISSFENAGDNAKRAITEFVENTVDTILSLKADFYDAGTTVTNRFITAADNLSGKAKASFAAIADNCISGIKGRKNNFADSASTIIIGFISGVRDKEERVKAEFIGIISGSISSIRNKVGDFESAGTILIMGLISGILARSQKAESSFRDICGSCESILRSRQTNFYDIGRYFDEGMAKGISDYAGNVKEAASEMAKSALESAKKELDINSPSKKMYKIGSFAGAGFINALNDCGKRSEEAGREMAESVRHGISTSISRISDAIDDHIDYQPTIRPVLDLSDVEKNARGLDAIFSREQALSIGSPQRSERSRDESTSTSDPVASISFTQNNYSPKALSRMEIYRQTRNQISTLKGLVTNR